MREKIGPWVAAIFCAVLSLITVTGNAVLGIMNGATDLGGGVNSVFYCFLPMCFVFVGALLWQLQRENRELRARMEELAPRPMVEKKAA